MQISIEAVAAAGGLIVIIAGGVFGMFGKIWKGIGSLSTNVEAGQVKAEASINNITGRIDRFIDYHEKTCPERDGTIKSMNESLTDIKVSVGKLEAREK